MSVNKDQKLVLYIASALVAFSLLFPPAQYFYEVQGTAFSSVFKLQGKHVSWGFLIAIQTGITMTAIGLFMAFQD